MPRVWPRLSLFVLSGALVLTGCDSMPSRTAPPDPSPQAERDFEQGDFSRAAQGFMEAASTQVRQRDRFLLRAAEAWREEGDLTHASHALKGITDTALTPDLRQRLGLLRAEIALSQGQPELALSQLDQIKATLDPAYLARALELRTRAAEADGNYFHAAKALSELAPLLTMAERRENTRRITALLKRLDDSALSFAAASLSPVDPLYPHVARALSARHLPLPHAYSSNTDEQEGDHEVDEDGYRPFSRIALLLPLDSALGDAAQAIRDGFMAGYFQEARQRPVVQLYATQNDPSSAIDAWRAAQQTGAQLIIGPLGREEVSAIFSANQETSIPILALNRSNDAPPPAGSMTFAMTPEDEGIAAANRIADQGGKRVLVIRNNEDYSTRATQALMQRLSQRDAQVVGTAILPSDSPNYAPVLQAAIAAAGFSRVDRGTDTRIEENRLSIEADAIFYAGRTDQAHLLASQLRMAGIYDLPIYATSQIAAGAGDARLDRELDGIEFTEVPWAFLESMPNFPSRTRMSALPSLRGNQARLFAFGLDAARLAGYFDYLRSHPHAVMHGATGELRFDGFGQLQRTPGWARFQGGRIQASGEPSLIGDELQFHQP